MVSIEPCLHTQLLKGFPGVGAFDHLEWTYNGAFEQLFGLGRGEFEQKFCKNSNARGAARGDVYLRFDWYISCQLTQSYAPTAKTCGSFIKMSFSVESKTGTPRV